MSLKVITLSLLFRPREKVESHLGNEKSYSIARRSNQSMLKEINPEYSLEGLMLKLTLQCFGHLM